MKEIKVFTKAEISALLKQLAVEKYNWDPQIVEVSFTLISQVRGVGTSEKEEPELQDVRISREVFD